jgi:hypothetical protein
MSIVLVGSTSGSCTLQEQAVAGTTVLTLPTTSGTILTTASSVTQNSGPAFYVTLGSNQTISSSSLTKLQYNTETFDTANCFDTSTHRFTPNVAGYYQINLNQEFSNTTNGQGVQILKNGARIASGGAVGAAGGGTFFSGCSVLCFLNGSTDYVEAYGYLNAGSGTAFGGTSSGFSGSLVRAS